MIVSVTKILWEAAQRPTGNDDDTGICRVCGNRSDGIDFQEWVRPTFTDWDKILPGDILCQACQFCFEERSTLLMARVGKEKLQRMRNYSHFVVDGAWIPLSKGNKVQMRDILLTKQPMVSVVAESGQKHIIFRAIPGIVQFEEQQIPDVSVLGDLLVIIEELYIGFSKSDITTGRYAQHRIRKFGLERWNDLERQIKSMRQSPLFTLALFLAQKEETGDKVTRKGRRASDSDMARSSSGLQEPLPGFDMATVRG
jgi:hypothetical protein